MTKDDVIRRIGEVGIIPVVRAASVDDAIRAVEAIYAGGIPIIEITMTVPNAADVIRNLARDYGHKIVIGAGTVTTTEQATMCLAVGAEFLVSPGLSLPVLSFARASGKLAIPGALTPTELMMAQENGATLVKIFPCGRALKGPFPDAELIPTGGVSASNAAEFIAAGAFALGVGGELVSKAALRDRHWSKITEGARDLVNAVRSARHLPENATV
jgi:2-dehydro-3-deoxyphosphogluconate aldolase/(4S)-4-hydroxy-2-oxoglutarate aldolase